MICRRYYDKEDKKKITAMLKINYGLHGGFVLVFCLSFFFKGRHFVMLHKKFFYQTERQGELILYLPEPTLSGSLICWNFVNYLFRKAFCNILILKFQNCLVIYMPLTQNNYWCKNTVFFLFLLPVTNNRLPDHLQTPTFQIIS